MIGSEMKGSEFSFAEAAVCSGWPKDVLEDFCKWPVVVESPQSFLNFVMYGNHSQAQMCVLRDGLRKLDLEKSLPQPLLEACKMHKDTIEAVKALTTLGDLDGDVFVWAAEQGELWCKRREIKGGSLLQRLEEAKKDATEGSLMYMAELSYASKTSHHLTGERCRTLTIRDVRDCPLERYGCEGMELPMWDRGHAFVGAKGAGSCLHVDQAWWSNISKNFAGYKLVALWSPGDTSVLELSGQLFRRPLSKEQTEALRKASTIALLGPGDVASFTGGLPHATVVVGDVLNLTSYESLVNWHPCNADLLLRGALRKPGETGAMKRKALHGLFDDIVEVVRRRVPEALDFCRGGLSPRRHTSVLLLLGSTNDDQGIVDGEVWHRAKKVVALWKCLKSAGKMVEIWTSGGADPTRFFNRTKTSHWRYVRDVLLQLGVPADELPPGLEALHTVDEALMSRQRLLRRSQDELELVVVTSAFHVKRARHLFNLAFRRVTNVEVLVLSVPNACSGVHLQAYEKKETETLQQLRTAPFGMWLEFLREDHAEEMNATVDVCKAFYLSNSKADALRSTFRERLRTTSVRCRRRLAAAQDQSWDSSDSRDSENEEETTSASSKRPRTGELK